MTLLLASLSEEMAVLAADTAISTVIDEVAYRVVDDYTKLHVIGETLVFLSGDVNLSEWTIRKYKRSKVKGADELRRIMQAEYGKYCAIRPNFEARENNVGLFGFLCQLEKGHPVGYLINSAKGFEIERCTSPANDSVTVTAGVNEGIAQSMLTEAYAGGIGALQAYEHIFDTLAGEKIGGRADVYLMDRNGIRKIHSHAIKEPKLNRVDRRYARSAVVLDRQIQTLMLDAIITGSHINVGNGSFTVDGSTGHMKTTSGEFSGSITASTITGGSINADTSINVTQDARIGNNLYMGLAGAVNDRRIEFVKGGGYEAFIGFTTDTSELKIRAGNDIRIDSGLDVFVKGMDVALQPQGGDAYVGGIGIPGNRIVVASELAEKADVSTVNSKADRSTAGYNLAFDSTTRNLKMFSQTGDLLATVNIPK
ncbi:hypothetical protein [Paenibacillus graminis]|uniref:hypothetical protein n=1 Tax=Paenibacillus graminis TaxID=189425 RepID=UPI002DB5D81D|nr:hypothetical protein [Paenibacillus graminis]MEC0167485.1 hypothetical protein [Paenibacillus graminis]